MKVISSLFSNKSSYTALILIVTYFVCMIYFLAECGSATKKYLMYLVKKKEKYYFRKLNWDSNRTAIIVVDMWDKCHWILFEKRIALLEKNINLYYPYSSQQSI